jgi:hypothetical protein
MEVSAKLFLSDLKWIKPVLVPLFILLTCPVVQGCDKTANAEKGVNIPMETYYIGRFSLAVPVEMKLAVRTSELSFADIKEVIWDKNVGHEQARITEWNKFIRVINTLNPPEGKDTAIIKMRDFTGVGQWAKGVYYYYDDFSDYDGRWVLLVDTGPVGVWFKGNSVVEKENVNHYLENNIKTSGNSYTNIEDSKLKSLPKGHWFFLKHGAINLPYNEQEESYASFKGHPLNLVLEIKMEMDFRYERETMGLIEKTKGMLAAAAFETGGSMSKIRLAKREVAGMKGEESILRISEDGETTLMFTWEFNGKEDSGEYPTTTIEMEAPDGKLDEKIAIWDAVLDSMKPMFERKN